MWAVLHSQIKPLILSYAADTRSVESVHSSVNILCSVCKEWASICQLDIFWTAVYSRIKIEVRHQIPCKSYYFKRYRIKNKAHYRTYINGDYDVLTNGDQYYCSIFSFCTHTENFLITIEDRMIFILHQDASYNSLVYQGRLANSSVLDAKAVETSIGLVIDVLEDTWHHTLYYLDSTFKNLLILLHITFAHFIGYFGLYDFQEHPRFYDWQSIKNQTGFIDRIRFSISGKLKGGVQLTAVPSWDRLYSCSGIIPLDYIYSEKDNRLYTYNPMKQRILWLIKCYSCDVNIYSKILVSKDSNRNTRLIDAVSGRIIKTITDGMNIDGITTRDDGDGFIIWNSRQ